MKRASEIVTGSLIGKVAGNPALRERVDRFSINKSGTADIFVSQLNAERLFYLPENPYRYTTV